MKILVMKFRNIGDVLLTTPLISNLKYHYPNAQIHFALNSGTQMMITQNPNVDKIHIYERKKRSVLGKLAYELSFALSLKKEKFDMIIQTTKGDRGLYLAKFCGAKTVVSLCGRHPYLNKFITNIIKPHAPMLHNVEQNLLALEALGLKPKDKKVEIFFDQGLLDGLNLPHTFVHIHPLSRWMFKCIKDEIMADIIDFIEISLETKVVLTADNNPSEIAKINSILKHCNSKPINLSAKLSLKSVAALSKKSKLFVGVDTAIMHMAAANDVRVVAFFGPSGAFEWGPWDNQLLSSAYTQKNGLQSMGKHIVIQNSMACIPCGQDGCNGSKISDCLMSINTNLIKSCIADSLNLTAI